MKRFLLLPLLAAASLAAAQSVKMSMNIGGMNAGTATVSMKQNADGTVSGRLLMNFDFGGQKGTGDASFVYTRTARPKSVVQQFKIAGQSQTHKETYAATYVDVVKTENGKTTRKRVPIPKGAKLEDPSAFWFWKTKPKVGATSTHWRYDSDQGKFVKSTSKYVGLRTITVGGRKVQAHYMTQEDGEQWVDNKGMPLRLVMMESGMEIVMERLWK